MSPLGLSTQSAFILRILSIHEVLFLIHYGSSTAWDVERVVEVSLEQQILGPLTCPHEALKGQQKIKSSCSFFLSNFS